MSRALWLRFLAISVFFALMLSALYLALVREVAGTSSEQTQRSIYLFLAHIVEEGPYAQSLQRVAQFESESRNMQIQMWVISGSGQVLAGGDTAQLPRIWQQLGRPLQVHEVVTRGRFFSGAPAAAVVRLNAAEPVYLVIRNPGQPGQHVFLWLALFFVASMVGAMVIGLLLVTLYLRGRSRLARHVIAQMESGDLGARFGAGRLDAVGGLMLDFNRMADEIQRLVNRLQTTERTRRDMLQELGHDLRTPLTSLKTAVETLALHGDAMPAEQRQMFCSVIASESDYFAKLIDDLFFIAEIDEPRYRNHAGRIDLHALLEQEVRTAQSSKLAEARHITLTWRGAADAAQAYTVVGDAHLVARLLRNVFDNALKHARANVYIAMARRTDHIEVIIEDDGPGMSELTLARFGQRRTQRLLAGADTLSASLGLGSVILKTIVELHGGHFTLESNAQGPGPTWTRMTIALPVSAT